jgi:hypothetical protein
LARKCWQLENCSTALIADCRVCLLASLLRIGERMTSDDDDDYSITSSLPLSSNTADRGVSVSLKRSLLADIDEAGGLDEAVLESIILLKPDVYGYKDTPFGNNRRRQLQNLVDYWKKSIRKGTFDKIRRELSRVSFHSSPSPAVSPTTPILSSPSREVSFPQKVSFLEQNPKLSPTVNMAAFMIAGNGTYSRPPSSIESHFFLTLESYLFLTRPSFRRQRSDYAGP